MQLREEGNADKSNRVRVAVELHIEHDPETEEIDWILDIKAHATNSGDIWLKSLVRELSWRGYMMENYELWYYSTSFGHYIYCNQDTVRKYGVINKQDYENTHEIAIKIQPEHLVSASQGIYSPGSAQKSRPGDTLGQRCEHSQSTDRNNRNWRLKASTSHKNKRPRMNEAEDEAKSRKTKKVERSEEMDWVPEEEEEEYERVQEKEQEQKHDQEEGSEQEPEADQGREELKMTTGTKKKREKKKRRTGDGTLKYVVAVVQEWREIFFGKHWCCEGGKRSTLKEAAKVVGENKKTLDYYLQLLRKGKEFGFDFQEHSSESVGVLATFVEAHRAQQRGFNESHSSGHEEKDQL